MRLLGGALTGTEWSLPPHDSTLQCERGLKDYAPPRNREPDKSPSAGERRGAEQEGAYGTTRRVTGASAIIGPTGRCRERKAEDGSYARATPGLGADPDFNPTNLCKGQRVNSALSRPDSRGQHFGERDHS
jgi:hypothetical protein